MKNPIILSVVIAFSMMFTLANFNTLTAQQTIEDQYWNLVKDSKRVVDFQYYRKEYPNGKYVALAHLKLN